MTRKQLEKLKKDLAAFVELFGPLLGRSERRYWCKMYLSGLMLDGKRKSIEPMSVRLPGGNEQAMQQFVNQSPWEHELIEEALVGYMLKKLHVKDGLLILDDTTLPKKGNHSVGVARQYCGALGKVANCQSVVTWHYASGKAHLPVAAELYLPRAWTEDKRRLDKAGVPQNKRAFREKWRIALELLERYKDKIPCEAIVFDAGYGEIRPFLHALDKRGKRFVAQIPESHCFWPTDTALKTMPEPVGRPRTYPEVGDKSQKAVSAKDWKERLLLQPQRWQTVTIPLQRPLKVKVAALRVKEANQRAYWRPGPERWLLVEQLSNGSFRYYVSNMPEKTSLRKLLNWAHQRWTIEQGYQQLKQELGLDHFEGRSWRGLHHHLILCFMAFAFLLLLRKKKTIL